MLIPFFDLMHVNSLLERFNNIYAYTRKLQGHMCKLIIKNNLIKCQK